MTRIMSVMVTRWQDVPLCQSATEDTMLNRLHLLLTGCATCAALASFRSFGMAAALAPTDEIRGPGYVLRYTGSIREAIMMGKRDAVLDLRTLNGKPHLWGLGALGGLTGEVTIADGLSLLARVGTDRSIQVTEGYDGNAAICVWAEVPSWQTTSVPPSIRTYSELEMFVGDAGKKAALSQAFPFVVTGRPKQIDFHVVDAKPDTLPGMAAHQAIQIPFEAHQSEATLVGFWSSQHEGIFTPKGSKMHVHFQSKDSKASGHVQGLDLTQREMTLRLPKA
jgi:alpha-acetolactate decarboxylase